PRAGAAHALHQPHPAARRGPGSAHGAGPGGASPVRAGRFRTIVADGAAPARAATAAAATAAGGSSRSGETGSDRVAAACADGNAAAGDCGLANRVIPGPSVSEEPAIHNRWHWRTCAAPKQCFAGMDSGLATLWRPGMTDGLFKLQTERRAFDRDFAATDGFDR